MIDTKRPAITLDTRDGCTFHYGNSHEEHVQEMERQLNEADRRIAEMSNSPDRCEAEYMGRRCELERGHTLTLHKHTESDGHVVRWHDEQSDNKEPSDIYPKDRR